jgi:hypothetical protein
MSAVGRSPLSPSSPGCVLQAATDLEPNSSVSYLHHFFSAVVYDLQTLDSGLGLFANAHNIVINGGTFVNHFSKAA